MTRTSQSTKSGAGGSGAGQGSPKTSRHGPVAQLLIALSPLSLILLAYIAARWINTPLAASNGAGTNRLGFGLHLAGPAHADGAVFGTVPSVWLQRWLFDGSAHWWDAIAALIYSTHFVSFPLVTAVVWFRLRDRFTSWIAAVLTLTALGVAGYVVHPAAPPWLTSQRGQIGPVARISSPGWDYLHLHPIGRLLELGQHGSNPVAAMPSLHAASALLIVLFLWPLATTPWRAALAGYALLMAITLVYTGEHYVVDVVLGWAVAVAAMTVGGAVRRGQLRQRCNVSEGDPDTVPVHR